MNCRLPGLLLGFLTISIALHAQNRVEFSFQNTRAESGLYYAELWADVNDGDEWTTPASNITVRYNTAALSSLNANPAFELDEDFESLGYTSSQTSNPSELRINLLKLGLTFAVKTGSFRIATIRWNVLNGRAYDSLAFSVSGAGSTQVFHASEQLYYDTGDSSGYSVSNPPPQLIDSLEIEAQPQSQSLCTGQDALFTVSATGSSVSYQWQFDSGSGFGDINGATSDTLHLANVAIAQAGHYRVQIQSNAITDFSTSAALMLAQSPDITQPPQDAEVCASSSHTFSVQVIGTPELSIQWQQSPDGANWNDIPGATSTALTLSAISYAMSGTLYRAHVTNTCATVISDPAILYVLPAPEVIGNPASTTASVGQAITLEVVSGTFGAGYQWQVDKGSGYTDIPGATESMYAIAAAATSDAGFYRAILSNACSTPDTSAAAQLQVFEYSGFDATLYLGGYWNGLRHRPAAVLIELYSGSDLGGATLVSRHSAVIESGGNINANLRGVPAGLYWVVVRHGGHFGVASASRISINPGSLSTHDFSNPAQVLNGGQALQQENLNGNTWYTLRTGDLDGDLNVLANDFLLLFLPNFGVSNPGGIPAN